MIENALLNLKTDEKLLKLLEEAKKHVITPYEAYHQRLSFIWGQLPERNKVTIEEVKEFLKKQGIIEPDKNA